MSTNTQWMQHEAIRGGGKPGAASKPQASKQSKPWGQRDMGKLQFADDGMYGDAEAPEQPLGPMADGVHPFFIGAQDTSKPWWLQDNGETVPNSPVPPSNDAPPSPPSPPSLPIMGDAEAPPTVSAPASDSAAKPDATPQGPPNQSKLDELNAEKLALLQGLPTKGHSPWWAQLAANAVGGLAGWSNAASRTAHPINIAATKEGLLHPLYNEQMNEAQSKLAPIDAQIEQVQGQNANWWNNQKMREEAAYKAAESQRATAQAKYYMDRSGNQWKMDPRSGVLYNTQSHETIQPEETGQETFDKVLKITGNKDAATAAMMEHAYHVKYTPTKPMSPRNEAMDTILHPDQHPAEELPRAQGLIHPPKAGRAASGSAPVAAPTGQAAVALKQAAANNPLLDFDAWTYMTQNGKLNVRGGRNATAAEVAKIKGRANQIMLENGLTPGDLYGRNAELKSSLPALAKVSTNAAMVETFEDTLKRNAVIAQNLSDQYGRGDVRMYNNVLSAFKTGTGDPEALNLAAQLHGISREWGKIMAGSTGTMGVPITEANSTDEFFKGISDGQLNSFINKVVLPDAASRKAANEGERQVLIGRIKGVASPSAPAGGQPVQQMAAPIIQHSPSTGAYRYSIDGGKTWQAGQPQVQPSTTGRQ